MRADVFGIRAFLFWSDRSRCNQWRCVRIATANYQINEEIRDKEVRVIGADGAQLGIMSSAAALEIAIEKDLDLVKIAPGSNPPVCKIMDYGKYRFEQAKREKEARRNQHVIEVKETRHRRERLQHQAEKRPEVPAGRRSPEGDHPLPRP